MSEGSFGLLWQHLSVSCPDSVFNQSSKTDVQALLLPSPVVTSIRFLYFESGQHVGKDAKTQMWKQEDREGAGPARSSRKSAAPVGGGASRWAGSRGRGGASGGRARGAGREAGRRASPALRAHVTGPRGPGSCRRPGQEAKMAAEREPPPLGDVKPTDFEELEDGEDLFTSTVSTLEVRRPPGEEARAVRLASPLPRLVPYPPTPPGLARPGRVTPVTPAAPQVPVKGPDVGLGGQASGRQPAGLGADPPSARGQDPRTEANLPVLAGGRALGPSLSPAPLPPGRSKACLGSPGPPPLPRDFSSSGLRCLFLCPTGGCALPRESQEVGK